MISLLKKVYWYCKKTKNRLLTDVVVLSFPKSGRTWLRVLLAKYYSLQYDHKFVLNFFQYKKHISWKLPYFFFHHAIEDDLTEIEQKGLSKRIKAKTIILVRDPRDVVVSYYFQVTKRQVELKEQYFGDNNPSIEEFLRHPQLGIATIIRYMNEVYDLVKNQRGSDFLVVSYEQLHQNGEATIRKILEYAEMEEINDDVIKKAYEFGSFENMKKLEKGNKFTSPTLKPGDDKQPESFKVRKGKIGGYKDYLSQEDIDYANKELALLNPVFGY